MARKKAEPPAYVSTNPNFGKRVKEPIRTREDELEDVRQFGITLHLAKWNEGQGTALCGNVPEARRVQVMAPLDHPGLCRGCLAEFQKSPNHTRIGGLLAR